MRIHLVIEDDQGETFRVEKKGDGYSLLYNPITDYSEEPISNDELINRINFALSLRFHVEIANIENEIENDRCFKTYNVNKVTPKLFEDIRMDLEKYYILIRRNDEEAGTVR